MRKVTGTVDYRVLRDQLTLVRTEISQLRGGIALEKRQETALRKLGNARRACLNVGLYGPISIDEHEDERNATENEILEIRQCRKYRERELDKLRAVERSLRKLVNY